MRGIPKKTKPLNSEMTEHRIDLSQLASIRDGTGHTIFSPSSSAMWLYCAGSLIPNLLAEDDSGVDAAWGTVAHELTENQLRDGTPAKRRLGERVFVQSSSFGWGYLIDIDSTMIPFVQDAVDFCKVLPGKHYVETRNYFSRLTPLKRQGGTADHCACTPGMMVITDHKFGKGHRVDAALDHNDPRSIVVKNGETVCNGNSQGMLYALGFFFKYDAIYNFKRIIIRISQPRLDHYDEWETTREELLKFAEFVKVRSHVAWKLNAPRRPSEKACLWCKVQSTCAARAVHEEALVGGILDEVGHEIPDDAVADLKRRLADGPSDYALATAPLTSLTTKEMATLYTYRGAAEKWWKKLGEELLRRADNGETIPGYKMVEARSNRVFKSKGPVIRLLTGYGIPRDKIVEEVLVSPAQADDLLRGAGVRPKDLQTVLAPVVSKPPGRPTLAPMSDKRVTLEDLSEDAFRD